MTRIRLTERPFSRDPWLEFEHLRQGMDQLSRSFFAGEPQLYGRATVYPPLNIYENKDKIIIKAEIPGVTGDDLDISIEGDTITLQGKRDITISDDKISYHRHEIENGCFSRAIGLPVKVDLDTITAKLNNGILTISLDKAAEVKPRQINVTTE